MSDLTATRIERMRRVLTDVAADVEADATRFDGQPFTGRTVAEYFGNHGAAIKALADIVKELFDLMTYDHAALGQRQRPIISGSHPIYGRVAAVGVLGGERYYWFVKCCDVAMMPAVHVEADIKAKDAEP